jgi:TonB-dependent receptor
MNNNRFVKTKIATSLSIILGALSAPVIAADEEKDKKADIEVIEIKGIRGSVIKAMDIKRSSSGVVDAISAEDIGKFPDTNLAESLQRISGVSIDRANGEGSKVTVRGFGPEYNLVTLNGRQMPASSLEATSASTSRAFDFANLAAEGVAGVEIYKTGKASVSSGGMGSTINIVTTKPLKAPGEKATFGFKGVMDTSSEDGAAITPELSGLYSNTFADDTVGIALSGSYQERESGNAQANSGGWRTFPGNINGWDWGGGNAEWGGVIPAGDGAHQNFNTDPESIYSVPQSLGYAFHEVQRVRTNAQAVIQFRPVDAITATVDYTYSKNEVSDQYNDVSAWFNFGPSSGEWTGGDVSAPLVYTEAFAAPGDLAMGGGSFQNVNENKSLGINLEWQVNSNLELSLDHHNSTAESRPDSPYGSNNVIGTATWVRDVSTAYFGQDFPVLEITYPDGFTGINAADVRVAGSSFRNSMMKSEVTQTQLDGTYVFDSGMVESIDFGVSMTEVQNRSAFSNVQQDNWGGLGGEGDLDTSLFQSSDVASYFDVPGSDSSLLISEFFMWDFEPIRQTASDLYGALGATGDCGTSFCASSDYTTDRRTTEEQTAAYIQANLTGDLGGNFYNLNVGVRYEKTDVTSSALVPIYSNIAWAGDNEFNLVATGEQDFTNLTGSYSNVLPNIDFNIELMEDIVLRASYSTTIARPGYGDIQGGQTVNSLVRIDGGTGSRGNPDLKPFESDNIDLTFEWYYDEGSYAAIGYFMKDSKNFIGRTTVEETTFNLTHPAQGDRYDEAVAAGAVGNTEIRDYISTNYPETLDSNGFILGVPGDDVATFDITIPVNQESAELTGWEFAVQHLFGESGFGVIANATIVDGDIDYDVQSLEEQFAILGMSDSYNFIAFYDNNGIQARIAYNWRDTFLASTVNAQGLQNPIFVEAYGQWDANISYDYSENLTFFVEGINLTDEYGRSHERNVHQVVNVTQTGPRFNIGARYNF